MRIREDDLIERIRRLLPSRPGGELRLGIGDDAAVLRAAAGREWVISCDQFLEGAHFLAEAHPARMAGYKALARATSDLAAMGARPRLFLLSLALPAGRAGRWLDEALAGMAEAARRFAMRLAGGDTARSSSVAFSITVLGDLPAGRAVRRDGARPGDALYVTGRLGAAELGLELVRRGLHRQRQWARLLAPHYYPRLRLAVGQWLASRKLASAMMDLSDGLSTDLGRLCRASGVGARVCAERIPTVRVPAPLRRGGFDALQMALHGGEDYELLFTVPRRLAGRIPRAVGGTPVTRIGEIVAGRGVTLARAKGEAPLEPGGWDHFARR